MASHVQAHASAHVAHRLSESGRSSSVARSAPRTEKQESAPEWLRDAIDAVVVAAILLTLAMAAVLGQ
jgi:hypothetical protein